MNSNYLFDQTFKIVKKWSQSYYVSVLQHGNFNIPELKGEKVNFSREGWSHLHEKTRSRMELLSRYFALIKVPLVLTDKNSRMVHEKGKDATSEFWVFFGSADEVMIKVIIRSIKGGNKHFYSVVWKGEEKEDLGQQKRAVSRLYPRCRGMITPQLLNKRILSKIGKLSMVKNKSR